MLILVTGQLWPASCLEAERVGQTQARLVSTLRVGRLPVGDQVKKPVYFAGKVSGSCCCYKHGFHKSRHILGHNNPGGAPIKLELLQSSRGKPFKAAVACLADFLDILCQYMSEFMKTLSTLQQNFFACLPAIAGRKASVVRLNPGGVASRRLAAGRPGVWLPADSKRGSQDLSPGGVGWVTQRERERGTFLS